MSAAPSYDEDMMGERLRHLAEMAGYDDLAKFARAAGVEPGTAQKHAIRHSVPLKQAQKYIAAAEGTGADLDWLLTGRGKRPQLRLQSKETVQLVSASPNIDADATTPVPLWRMYPATGRVGAGAPMLMARSEDTVQGPGELRTSKAAFALYVWDDENAPWLRRGWTLFVNPAQMPADGHWSVFTAEVIKDGQTFYRPHVAILLGSTAGGWRIQRGSQKSTLPAAEWPHAWKVVYIKQS